MDERVAIITGVRTPFCKASGILEPLHADDLGGYCLAELVARSNLTFDEIDEVVLGNVLQPADKTNIARIIAYKAGLPKHIPAMTVNRNCSSGMDAVVFGANKILLGDADTVIAGGVESMSHFPILFPEAMKTFLMRVSKAKTLGQRLKALLSFRPSLLKPNVPKIADPICDLSMGQTAEILSQEFHVTREEQDAFALMSQTRAVSAQEMGRFDEEIMPIPLPPNYEKLQTSDDGPRAGQTIEALSKLRPVFDRLKGTVTAGNSSQVTDGACALILMRESLAKERGYAPLGYIKAYAYAALDPARMGLGPVFATSKLLKKTGMTLKDFDLIEINEAFAAQVLAVQKAAASDQFAKEHLGRDKALGEIETEKLNVNGGAVALGHPLGASGARLILTLLLELKKEQKQLGLATLCVGGGQGEACIVEAN